MAADGLHTLRNGLRMSDHFALFVAVVNRPAVRDSLIRELAASVPDLNFSTVRLSESTADPLDDVLRQAGSPPPGPVMVVDFNAALPSDAAYHPILQALNLRRPEWPKAIPHPVIFWVPEYAFTLLAREAPDFLDWRSLTAFFTDATERDLIPLRSDAWNQGPNTNFTKPQREARIAELESRLALDGMNENDRRILTARADWLNELGLHRWHFGDLEKAIESFRQALVACRETEDREGESAVLANLGNAWADLGDMRKAFDCYERALVLSHEIRDRHGEGVALGNLGCAWAELGESRKAIDFHEQALTISRETKDRQAEGHGLGNLGNAWADLGDARKAADFHERCLAVTRKIRDRRGESAALGNLGRAWAELGDARKAFDCYEQALAVSQNIGDRRGEATNLANLAVEWAGLGDFSKAIDLSEQALAIAREIGDRRVEGGVLVNLGEAWANRGEVRKAINFYEQGLAIVRGIGDRRVEAEALFKSAVPLRKLGQVDDAIRRAEDALNIYNQIDGPHTELVRRTLAQWRSATSS